MSQQQTQRARVLGSNYTTFRYKGQSIAYLEMVSDQGQEPVAQPEAIHPLGYTHPTEWATPRAINGGQMTITIRERWNQEVWQQLAGLANSHDIVEVFKAVAEQGNPISCTKIIKPPNGVQYGKTYHNCIVGRVPDGEEYSITTMTSAKPITIYYTHTTAL